MLSFASVRHALKLSVLRIVLSLVTGLALISAVLAGLATIPVPALADIPISTFPYTQNFDSLENSGGPHPWTDDSTIGGWFIAETVSPTQKEYLAGSGTINTGGIYSFGTLTETDRALGSLSSGGTSTQYYGVRLRNDTGSTIYTISVKYVGEQWRSGGANAVQNKLEFTYQVSPAITSLTEGSWTDVDALDFIGPVISTTSAISLDGNIPANRVELSALISLVFTDNHELMLRWEDTDDAAFDHALAVDDLEITLVENNEGVKVYLPILIK